MDMQSLMQTGVKTEKDHFRGIGDKAWWICKGRQARIDIHELTNDQVELVSKELGAVDPSLSQIPQRWRLVYQSPAFKSLERWSMQYKKKCVGRSSCYLPFWGDIAQKTTTFENISNSQANPLLRSL